MSDVGIILLAAGESSRMGRPKQLLDYSGRPLVRRAAEAAIVAGGKPIVVVTGSESARVSETLSDLPGIVTECNADWSRGMGTSIRTGIKRVLRETPTSEAVLVMLCDQPHVTADHLRALMHLNRSIVATAYDGQPGVPCVFSRKWFEALQQLPDDQGAKRLIASAGEELATIPLPAAAMDIDTPEDYQRLIKPV